MKYEKREISWLIVFIFSIVISMLTGVFLSKWGNNPMTGYSFLFSVIFSIFCLSLFYQSVIRIEGNRLLITLGIGIFRCMIDIDQISNIERVDVSLLNGLGVRHYDGGMIYNVQSSSAVKIKYMKNSKSKMVIYGTSYPDELIDSLRKNTGRK